MRNPKLVTESASVAVDGESAGENFVQCDSAFEKMPQASQDALTKIADLCEFLLQGQARCVELLKSETDQNDEIERLIGTLENLQTEIKSYRDRLTKDFGHATAASLLFADMRKELEQLLGVASRLMQKGCLPISGGSVISSLETRWCTMSELIEQCSILADMQSTRPVTERDTASDKANKIAVDQVREVEKDPLNVEQSGVKTDFEEAMEAFHAFVLSENLELKNASVQTEGLAQTFESCVDPENASSTVEGLKTD